MNRQAIAIKLKETWNAWHLAMLVVPLGDTCR